MLIKSVAAFCNIVFQTKNEINLSVMQDAGRKGTYPNCPGETKM